MRSWEDNINQNGGTKQMIKHTKRGLKADMKRRSKQNWERGRGAKRKGNPRYKPVRRKGKDAVIRKLYVLRGRK
tara:strand:+ start:1319 stop:1540 length:222 start_codon:yes stop_codon:yes gene_type:complete